MNPEIKTQRLLLRKYRESDREAHTRLFMDEDVNLFFPGGHCSTKEEAWYWFDKNLAVYHEQVKGGMPHHEAWAVEWEGQVIGHVDIKSSSFTEVHELEITGLLLKEYWRTGLAKEVFPALHDHVRNLDKKLIATVHPENTASINLIINLGGTETGKVEFEGNWFLKFCFNF